MIYSTTNNKKITLLIFVSIILLSSVSKASISSELTKVLKEKRKENENLFDCQSITTGCTDCIGKNYILFYPCYWCMIDNECHDVGSLVSPCTPPSADDKCVSMSNLSNCVYDTC